MNSTPPSSSAVRILAAVLVRPPIGPSRASNRLMVGVETPAASANSSCDQDSRARAAFICRIDTFSIDFRLMILDTFCIDETGPYTGKQNAPAQVEMRAK